MKQRFNQPASPLSDEDIHDVLRNERRRRVIDILQSSNGAVSVRELSEEIGSIESERNPAPRNIKQSVYVSLLQTHLPKLDELGIVDYQAEGKMVNVDGSLKDVTVYMEKVPKYGLSNVEYYAALGLLGMLTLFAVEIGTPLLSMVQTLTWAYAFLGLIFLSGLYHTLRHGYSIVHRFAGD